jgi:SAM-dependent methyltransferase
MATGKAEAAMWFSWFADIGLKPRLDRALDFGCGVGRLTQALASRYREVIGIDIAPSMVELAEQFNQNPSVRFVQSDKVDLSMFPDGHFDLVFSVLVLQHIPPIHTRRYLVEFSRLLRPGGVLAFQLPGEFNSLPEKMFSADLEVDQSPTDLAASDTTTVTVRVTNTSTMKWPEGERLRLGNHWRKGDDVILWNDGRTVVPPLRPDESVVISLEVTAPATTGVLELEVDLVAEGIAWFAERQSRPESTKVRITLPTGQRRSDRMSNPAPGPEPVMEMHHIPREEVISLLKQTGLRIVKADMTNDKTTWVDYSYVAVLPRLEHYRRQARQLRRRLLPIRLRRGLKRLVD